MPGFTYPVTDMYLEDVLRLIGYQDALLAQQDGAPARRGHGGIRPPAQTRVEKSIPKEQREAIESAIMQAFLHGSDEHFDHLLDVSHSMLVLLLFLCVFSSIESFCCVVILYSCKGMWIRMEFSHAGDRRQ